MNIYVLSDSHIKYQENAEDQERRYKVLQFLESIKSDAALLVLNGDIFDLWYDWNTSIIKEYFPILKKLADLRENGCEIVYIAGNHDFWFGDFFPKTLGIAVYPDDFTRVIDGKRMLFTHGDRHTSNDLRYKVFRTLIRTRFIRGVFEILHPDIALGIGKMLSRSSRNRKTSKPIQVAKESGLERFAKRHSKEYDIIVMGHSHMPKHEKYGDCDYLNSGDWVRNNTYVKIVDGQPQLCQFAASHEEGVIT